MNIHIDEEMFERDCQAEYLESPETEDEKESGSSLNRSSTTLKSTEQDSLKSEGHKPCCGHTHTFGIEKQHERKPYIGPKEEAAEHDVYNRHILRGYRINYNSWSSTLNSLFECHNETVNIWTHGIAFLVAFVAFVYASLNELGIDVIAPTSSGEMMTLATQLTK